jgi:hypothetical protein
MEIGGQAILQVELIPHIAWGLNPARWRVELNLFPHRVGFKPHPMGARVDASRHHII